MSQSREYAGRLAIIAGGLGTFGPAARALFKNRQPCSKELGVRRDI
jgi:hypothetical protein